MNLDINRFNSEYIIRKMNKDNIDLMYNFCLENDQYYKYTDNKLSKESLLEDLNACPSNKSIDDKYFVGYFQNDELIALLDLIDGYPNDETIFIGFFMLNKKYQGNGLGSNIIDELKQYLKEMKYKYIELGIDENNSQAKYFWIKNCFEIIDRRQNKYLYAQYQI